MPRHELPEPVRAITERVVRSHGLEVFDLQLRRGAGGWVLRVVIDRPAADAGLDEESVGIVDCERVSRDLGTLLDVEDPLDHAYVLEVSSPGLDRPLRHAGDYRRFAGRLARIVLASAVDDQMFLTGRLRGIEGDAVMLEGSGGRVHRVPLTAIARARLEVEF